MTPMMWVVLAEGLFILALFAVLAAALDGKWRAKTRVNWLEAEAGRLAQAWAEKLAKAEMREAREADLYSRFDPDVTHDLTDLINRLEAYRQGAPARRLEGE